MKNFALIAIATFTISTAAEASDSDQTIRGDDTLNAAMIKLANFIADRHEAEATYAALLDGTYEPTDVPAFVLSAVPQSTFPVDSITRGADLDMHLVAFNRDRVTSEPEMFNLQFSANAAFATDEIGTSGFGSRIHDGQTLEANLADLEQKMIKMAAVTYDETIAAITDQSFDHYVSALALY